MHYGWAIEGAIGSDYKIDASYLSPHFHLVNRLESLCNEYDVNLIISENIYTLFSLKAKNSLRKIDVILMNEIKDPKVKISQIIDF